MTAHRNGVASGAVEAGLRRAATDELRPEVRAAHLARIRARAVALGPAGARSTPPLRVAWARTAAAVAAVSLLSGLGVGGAAWASQDALPGEPLYVVKATTERVSVVLHPTAGRATDHLRAQVERCSVRGHQADTSFLASA
jgi:hypothetical protein